ncbi:hypothetical protein BDY24DRAFT_417533 [Mrakia frigida]|uniref:uncharacterized protein n=1 Tax=Mrakia frigida TaxID=29902 RepID=UPI003FCC0EA8
MTLPQLPYELIEEIVRHSSGSSLLSWCLVSHDFLDIAGSILYETVSILSSPGSFLLGCLCPVEKQIEGIPPTHLDPPLLLPLDKIERIEIHVLLSEEEASILLDMRTNIYQQPGQFELAIIWVDDFHNAFWGYHHAVASSILLHLFQPWHFEGLEEASDEHDQPYFSGLLLQFYLE